MGFEFSPHALVSALIAALVVAHAPSLRAADLPGKSGASDHPQTVRLVSVMSDAGSEYIFVSPPEGGQPVKLLTTGEAKKKFSVLYQHRDELIDITVKPGGQATDMVTSLSSFKGPAGMKSPRAYIFEGLSERKMGTQSQAVVKISRFGQTRQAVIPNRPAPGGKSGPDAALLQTVKGLKEGDCIEVELAPGAAREAFKLIDIDIYREPVLGEFVKADTVKVGTRSIPAIVLKVAGEEKTFLLPSRLPLSPGEQGMVTLSRRLKPGYCVLFTARDDGDHSTLGSLRVDGRMRMSVGRSGQEFESTFVSIHFYDRGAATTIYFDPSRFRRPDEMKIEMGLRKALFSNSAAAPLNLKGDQFEKLKKLVKNSPQFQMAQDLQVRERPVWLKAYEAWKNARDDTERARIELEMALAAQEMSRSWKEEDDAYVMLLKSFLNDQQLTEVREMGELPKAPLE